MAKFLFAYHGGATPETEPDVQAVMTAWEAWMGSLGGALTDMGNPATESKTVAGGGVVTETGAGAVSGYSLYEAADIDAAVNAAKGCPIFDGGGTVEVVGLHEM